LFARVIDIRPDIVILREVGLVYLSFNVYFFLLLAEKTKVKKAKIKKAVKETFFLGMLST
jgi:hypothetical protein